MLIFILNYEKINNEFISQIKYNKFLFSKLLTEYNF